MSVYINTKANPRDPERDWLERTKLLYKKVMQKRMRVVGGKNLLPKWERFDRLQKTAQLLAGGVREPKGVHRFKTWEEFNEWKMRYQVQGGHRTSATS